MRVQRRARHGVRKMIAVLAAVVFSSSLVTTELTHTPGSPETPQSCPEGQRFQDYARESRVPDRAGSSAEWTQTLARIRQDAARWIPLAPENAGRGRSQPSPCVPDPGERRRLIVATYILDFVMANAAIAWQPGGRELVEWACDIVRGQPLSDREHDRSWFLASIAVLERVQGPPTKTILPTARRIVDTPYERAAFVSAHVNHADERLPGLGVWPLARAIAEELDSWPERRDEAPFQVSARRASQLIDRFKDAASHPDVHDEALVRWGYFELRRRQPGAALALFDQAKPRADDLMLRYWLHLFKGRALERLGRHEEAAASYERALDDVPDAQSAAFALGGVLAALNRTEESAAIVTRALRVYPPPFDPWVMYSIPSSRHWPELIDSLRRAIRS